MKSIISTWMRLAIFQTMSLGEGDWRLWFVVDELDALGAIDGLPDALARLRKFGGRSALGFQSISQVSTTYGHGPAQAMVENCGNTLVLRCSASEGGGTARFASRLIGEREVTRLSHSFSRSSGSGLSSDRDTHGQSEQHATESAIEEPLRPMQQYAHEFDTAWTWSDGQGLRMAPMRFVVEKNCADPAIVYPALDRLLASYRNEDLATQAIAINGALLPQLSAACGIPFELTFGWYEHAGRPAYKHDSELPHRLMKQGIRDSIDSGLPMHLWLTSPAHEIIDVCLPTQIAQQTSNADLFRFAFYFSNQDPNPAVIYHPTVVGDDFLVRIGAAVVFGKAPD